MKRGGALPPRYCEIDGDGPLPKEEIIELEEATEAGETMAARGNGRTPANKPEDSQETEAPTIKPWGNLDANAYATKKTIAQGMLDVALLTANASQLKYVLRSGKDKEFYVLMVSLISVSIVLQCLIGLGLAISLSLDLNKPEHVKKANILNNLTTYSTLLMMALNFIISAFGEAVYGEDFPSTIIPKTNCTDVWEEIPKNSTDIWL